MARHISRVSCLMYVCSAPPWCVNAMLVGACVCLNLMVSTSPLIFALFFFFYFKNCFASTSIFPINQNEYVNCRCARVWVCVLNVFFLLCDFFFSLRKQPLNQNYEIVLALSVRLQTTINMGESVVLCFVLDSTMRSKT